MSQEIELKLSLPRSALPALRRHPLIAGAAKQGNAVTLTNTYFDTPDLALKAAKVAVRTRSQGKLQLQTVKCAALSTGGLTQRPEWEQAFTGEFDFSAVDVPKVAKLLARHHTALVPLFTTRFKRETRLHAPSEAVRILVMIDTGEVVTDERSEPICELELELVQGAPADLLVLAAQLAETLPLFPSDISKAQRGYRLRDNAPAKAVSAEKSAIGARQTPVEAFRQLAQACLRQWQGNVAAAIEASDDEAAECIHQLRVSQRRLRSLLRLFAPALPAEVVENWNDWLRDNADRFGRARDLEVLYESIITPVIGLDQQDDDALAKLRQVALASREQARRQAREALDPATQGRLLLGLMTTLEHLPTNELIGAVDLRAFAANQLDRLRKRARRRHEAATDLVPARLHALRIAIKRLRYGLEFFAPLLADKHVAPYLKQLAEAQRTLGLLSDLDVARGTLAGWTADDASLNAPAAFVYGWHAERHVRVRRRAMRDLHTLLWGKSPWRR